MADKLLIKTQLLQHDTGGKNIHSFQNIFILLLACSTIIPLD